MLLWSRDPEVGGCSKSRDSRFVRRDFNELPSAGRGTLAARDLSRPPHQRPAPSAGTQADGLEDLIVANLFNSSIKEM